MSEACWQTAFDRNASVTTWQESKLIYVAITRKVIRARAGSKVRNFTAQYQKLRHRRTFASELLSGWKQPWRAEKHKQTEQVLLLIWEQLVIISIEKPSRQCVSVPNADNQEDGVLGGSSSSSRRGRRLTLKSWEHTSNHGFVAYVHDYTSTTIPSMHFFTCWPTHYTLKTHTFDSFSAARFGHSSGLNIHS